MGMLNIGPNPFEPMLPLQAYQSPYSTIDNGMHGYGGMGGLGVGMGLSVPGMGRVGQDLDSSETSSQLSPSVGMNSANIGAHTPSRFLPPDGYKWRKYGQKSVKGTKYPRSYYKCTYAGCEVKKYIEKVEDSSGKEVDRITYKGGEHTHDPNKVTKLNAHDQLTFKNSVLAESLGQQDNLALLREKERIMNAMARASQDSINQLTAQARRQVSEEQRMNESMHEENNNFSNHSQVDPSSPTSIHLPNHTTTNNTSRLVVETSTDVDHLDDGYNWRKYGEKKIKDFTRSYYKCSEEDCTVKKTVEQHNATIINTYEGTHNHTAPGLEDSSKKKKRKLIKSLEDTLQLNSNAISELDKKRQRTKSTSFPIDVKETDQQLNSLKSDSSEDSNQPLNVNVTILSTNPLNNTSTMNSVSMSSTEIHPTSNDIMGIPLEALSSTESSIPSQASEKTDSTPIATLKVE